MKIEANKIVIITFIAFFTIISHAAIINIPEGDIEDHSDSAISGSIAWFFETFGSGHTYILNTQSQDGIYKIKGQINIPSETVLKSEVGAAIQAQAEMNMPETNTIMIEFADNCELSGITADANRNASIVIRAVRIKNAIVKDCYLKDTRNYFENGFDGRGYGIHAWYVQGLAVDGCKIENIGCNPKIDPTSWEGRANAIDASYGSDLVVTNNEIYYALGHGVAFTSAINVEVHNNKIWHSGENARIPIGQTGDGVGAYHNGLYSEWLNWNISDNDIQFYGNHGIHISGRGIRIERNYISDGQYNGISIQDWRDPHDCMQDIWVIDNYIAGHGTGMNTSAQMRYPIYVNMDYKPGSIHISGTTGNTDVWWGDETCEGVDSCSLLTMDFNEDCKVDFEDFVWFAFRWGECTDPTNSVCY